MLKFMLILILILIYLYIFFYTNENFILLNKKTKIKKNSKNIKIPKKIWQTHKKNDLPKSSYVYINKMIKLNPEFEYNFFDNDDCYNYIKKNFSNKVLKAYNKIKPGAGKADIWRLAVILKEGGIYIDVDKVVHNKSKPFIDIIDTNDLMIHGRNWHIWGYNAPATNATLCAVPNHPVIKMTFDSVIDSILNDKPITRIGKYKGWAKLENYTGTPHLWKSLSYYTNNINMKEGVYNNGLIISNKIENQLIQNANYGNDLKELNVIHWSAENVFYK